jgi:hypothetical protein
VKQPATDLDRGSDTIDGAATLEPRAGAGDEGDFTTTDADASDIKRLFQNIYAAIQDPKTIAQAMTNARRPLFGGET